MGPATASAGSTGSGGSAGSAGSRGSAGSGDEFILVQRVVNSCAAFCDCVVLRCNVLIFVKDVSYKTVGVETLGFWVDSGDPERYDARGGTHSSIPRLPDVRTLGASQFSLKSIECNIILNVEQTLKIPVRT